MKSKLMAGALFLAAFSHAATLVAPAGTSFEDRTIGEALVIGKDDAGLDVGSNYWFYGGSASELVTDCVVTIADYSGFAGEKPALAPTTDEKALLVETDTRLTRAIQVAADGSAEAVDIGTGLYFDAMIQFTTGVEAPMSSTADKLLVWLYGSDDAEDLFGATTGLVVTAGYLSDAENNVTVKHYLVEAPAIVPNSWHRLTVKTLAALGEAATAPAGFVVFVDGVAVSSTEAKGVTGSALDALKPEAQKWAAANQLFPSLVKGGESNARTLTGVDLLGSCTIDNLSFTATAPAFAADHSILTLTWDESVESLAYSVNGGEAVSVDVTAAERRFRIELGAATTHYVVALTTTHASGSVAGVWTADPASALSGRTVTVDGSSVTVNVISGPPVCEIGDAEYGTLADAFAAVVPGAETTIALIGDITAQAYGVVAADAKIKLDLAGHTITGGDVLDAATGEAVGCVIKVLGELMIVDSSRSKTGRVVAVEPHASIACAPGTKLTITGGTFDGEILRDGATVEIYNGSFSGSPDVFVLKDCLPDWYEYEYANGFWTVIELPMPNYYYLDIPEVPGADPIISNYDTNEPIEDTWNIREGTRVSVVWEPWKGYKIIDSAREIITMNGPKSATAPNVKEIYWATVVIDQVEHCTITVVEQDSGKTVESDARYDSDNWTWIIITRTPAVGYALVDCESTEKICITVAKDYVITATVEPLPYPSYIPSTASDETKSKFETWVAEMAGGDRDEAGVNLAAYLLNVAPADAAEEAKLFKVTALSVGADGSVTVTTTTNRSGKAFNGKVNCKGKATLDEAEWLPKDDAKHHFFKAFLEVE